MGDMTFEDSIERRVATGVLRWIEWALEPDVIQDSAESDELKLFRRNFRNKIQSAIHQIEIADDLATHPMSDESPQE